MRTFYQGPDAVVTGKTLTVVKGGTYDLSGLDPDQLTISAQSSGDAFVAGYFAAIVAAAAAMLTITAGALWSSWWVGLGGTASILVLAAATNFLLFSRDDSIYVLVGVYRGVETELYTSTSKAKTFRIQYALREALESGPPR
jgi:hypothetical protein